MSSSDRLLRWNSLWRLDGGLVFCRTCHSEQEESEASLPFEHSRGCSYERYAAYPWNDLNRISAAYTVPNG